VLYVEELIGPDTVNTVPPATLDAFRDHGRVRPSLEEDLEGAHETMDTLARLGFVMAEITEDLLREGVRLFVEPFEKLLRAVDRQSRVVDTTRVGRQTVSLPDA